MRVTKEKIALMWVFKAATDLYMEAVCRSSDARINLLRLRDTTSEVAVKAIGRYQEAEHQFKLPEKRYTAARKKVQRAFRPGVYHPFGETWCLVVNPNFASINPITTVETGVLDKLVKKQEPWDALSRMAGTPIV